MIKHNDIEKSFYKFVSENLEASFSYAVNYGEVRFETNPHDLWLSIVFEDVGAGAKKFSLVRIDIFSRITTAMFQNDETIAIDRIREEFTKVSIPLYQFPSGGGTPTLVSDEKLIVINNDGRFTVDRVIINNLREEDLKQNLRRSSVFLRLKLLTDTVGGRTV
jgi:hypothetical protein